MAKLAASLSAISLHLLAEGGPQAMGRSQYVGDFCTFLHVFHLAGHRNTSAGDEGLFAVGEQDEHAPIPWTGRRLRSRLSRQP